MCLLSSGIDREAVENLFGKNFLTFDCNPKSRGNMTTASRTNTNTTVSSESPIPQQESSGSFPVTSSDMQYLDDIVNLVNTLRFLCIHKWSALGDTFLLGPSQMLKSMLNTRLKNIHWNEEWLD